MGRIRTIKPEITLNEDLYDLEATTGLPIRFAWAALPCNCDREGRFEWRPRRLGAQILPYDGIDFSRVLDALHTRGFLVRYTVRGTEYGCIPTFHRHQVVNNREQDSVLPSSEDPEATIIPPNQDDTNHQPGFSTREPRVDYACGTRDVHAQAEGKGMEGKGGEGNGGGAEPRADQHASRDPRAADTPPERSQGSRSGAAAVTPPEPSANTDQASSDQGESIELPLEGGTPAPGQGDAPAADSDTEQPVVELTPTEQPVVELPLKDGSTYPVMSSWRDRLARQYPIVDVDNELRRMEAWCDANPQRRKTRSGVARFVTTWLNREHDKGGSSSMTPVAGAAGGPQGKPRNRQEAIEQQNDQVLNEFLEKLQQEEQTQTQAHTSH